MLSPTDHVGLLLYGLAISILSFLVGESPNNIASVITSWRRSSRQQKSPPAQDSAPAVTPGPLRPLIFPCRTTHTRLFPVKHSLSYSYLQVGVPIGWQGNNPILGIDGPSLTPWFSIRATDYLARGQETSSLENKLGAYLSSQGENLKDYAHAYLVTAPRFLGYNFNPVSFWYLFSEGLRLEAMILEVNNTFDERRMYFMKRGVNMEMDTTGEEVKFKHTWPKDFHVSPFNSRKGDYSLAAVNPFTSLKDSNPKIDNVVTLKSSKGHAKIVARIFSTDSAIDPANMKTLDTARLISRWFWTGFLTFPRILKEAAILFFRRGLHVWYRPEVARTSIGRRPSNRERLIESIFYSFLHEQISLSSKPISLTYIPPTGSSADTLHLVSKSSTTKPPQELTLQVLTPQFYTDITTSIPADYISASATKPIETQTFTTTSHHDLAHLLTNIDHPAKNPRISITASIRASILATLRRKGKHTHILDKWVLQSASLADEQKNAYFKCATALVIAGGGLAGFDNVLDWILRAMQIGLAWKVIGFVVKS